MILELVKSDGTNIIINRSQIMCLSPGNEQDIRTATEDLQDSGGSTIFIVE